MKRLLPVVLVGLTITAIYLLYFDRGRPFDMSRSKEDLSISASELFADFREDESAANQKFLNKTVVVQGEVVEIGKAKNGMPSLKLATKANSNGVVCELDKESKHNRLEFHKGEKVKLKCICMDYYNDVRMTNCVEER